MSGDALQVWVEHYAARPPKAGHLASHRSVAWSRRPEGEALAAHEAAAAAGYIEQGPPLVDVDDWGRVSTDGMDSAPVHVEVDDDGGYWFNGRRVARRHVYRRWHHTEAGVAAIRKAHLARAWSAELPTSVGPLWGLRSNGAVCPCVIVGAGDTRGVMDIRTGAIIDPAGWRWHAWQLEPPEAP